jgi:DNA-binding transcriptional ArsR family regulator
MKTGEAVAALAALAQESRLEIFRLLVRAGGEGAPAGGIAEALEIPAATLSFHLKELKHAGLIDCTRDGRSLIYRADFEVMSQLVRFLTEQCCRGIPRRRPQQESA